MTRKRAGAMHRANQHGVAEPLGDELDAAQDERLHQDLAHAGFVLDQRQQVLAVELDHFAAFDNAGVHERRSARQKVRLTGELARPVIDNRHLAGIGWARDEDPAADNDEEGHARVACPDQHIAGHRRL